MTRPKLTQYIMSFEIIFHDRSIEIRGTPDAPLFNMRDLARSLGDLRTYLRKIKNLEPTDVFWMKAKDESNRMVNTAYLNETAMYRYVMRLKNEEAKEFQYFIYNKIIEMRRKVKDLQLEITALKENSIPNTVYQDYDINDYTDQPCVYLIHLQHCNYKFGVSGDIDSRLRTHRRTFKKLGCKTQVVKLWRCSTMQIMRETEAKIKRLAKQNRILAPNYGQTETLTTDDIGFVIARIDQYVEALNAREFASSRERQLEMQLELMLRRAESAEQQLMPK